MKKNFVLKITAGGQPAAADLLCECADKSCPKYYVGKHGIFRWDSRCHPRCLIVQARKPGFWSMILVEPECESEIDLPPLPGDESDPWWTSFLLTPGGATPNSSITIAVLDADLGELLDIPVVDLRTSEGKSLPTSTDGGNNSWSHGEVIYRLLSPAGFQPAICPNAKIIGVKVPAQKTGSFKATDVAAAIHNMVKAQQVDIINLSAGTQDMSFEGLRQVARYAARNGVLCVAAAGNEGGDSVAFPARYQEWIAVGAIGSAHKAPEGSYVRYVRDLALRRDSEGQSPVGRVAELGDCTEIFHWPFSCYGPDIDMLAPGTNLIVRKAGQPAFDVTGTSFAAPLVCGVLAATLAQDETFFERPRNEERTSYMRSVLRSLCRRVGLNPQYEGQGVLCVNTVHTDGKSHEHLEK